MNTKFEVLSESKEKIIEKLGLTDQSGNENWDSDVFYQSYLELKRKLEEGKKIERLTEFYADAFHKKRGREETDYEDRYSMKPLKKLVFIDWIPKQGLKLKKIIGGPNMAFEQRVDSKRVNALAEYGELEMVQYGSSRIYRVKPNQFVFIPNEKFEKNDVIGSEGFSACTAIVAKTKHGVFYSHLTTREQGVRDVVASLRAVLGDDQLIHIVRPKWEDETGKDQKEADDYELRWAETLSGLGKIKEITYPYIEIGSKRKGDIHETAILVADAQIRTVGYYILPSARDFNLETAIDTNL